MITVEIHTPPDMQKLMKSLSSKVGLSGLNTIMRAFGEQLVNSVQRNFDEEGRPEKWAPLKPATIRAWLRKRKTWISKGKNPFSVGLVGGVRIPLTKSGTYALAGRPGQPGGRKILTDTGRLRNSVHFRMLGKHTLALRAGTVYAATHQYGDPSRNIPARPFLMVQDEDWAAFRRQVVEWLSEL